MNKHPRPEISETESVSALAHAVGSFAQPDGDYATAIPALTLHRRSAPTEPLHCIYRLGLGVIARGCKQVLLGEKVLDYGPGQAILTTSELPVFSHVTQAGVRRPFLGLLLTLDARHILQWASEMELPQPSRERAYRPVSIERLDEALIDALVRLNEVLEEQALVPRLAPLIQQEITIRLLTGPHGPQLQHLVAAGSPSQQIAKAVA